MPAVGKNRLSYLQETAVASDRIIDALDMASVDTERAQKAGYRPNPLMLGLSGSQYVLRTIADIRASDLEASLIPLPFPDALQILEFAPDWLSDMSRVELTVRVVVLLLQTHHAQLAASPACRPLLVQLQGNMRTQVQVFKNVMGFNLAGLRHIRARSLARSQVPQAKLLKRRAMEVP
jgi:U3 small nucleolar RNA-associated protein 12